MTFFHTLFFLIKPPPIVLITFSVLFGIWWQSIGYSFYLPFFIWLSIATSFLLVKKIQASKIILYTTSFLIGAATYQAHYNQHQRWCEKITQKPVNLTLTIQEITSRDHQFLRHITTGSINSITLPEEDPLVGSVSKKIIIYTPKKLNVEIGDTIAVCNVILKKPPNGPLSDYFMKENIGGTIMGNADFKLIKRPPVCFMRWLGGLRDTIRTRLKSKLSASTFNFFSLLFLGNKAIEKRNLTHLKQEFKRWGISHYLARSGLHLVIFIVIWELLLKCVPLSFIVKHLLLLGITSSYLMLSWISIPFLRSFLLFIFYKIGILANKYSNPLHALAFITLILLIINPMHLFFLDFQLSFGITFILSWVNQVDIQQKAPASSNP